MNDWLFTAAGKVYLMREYVKQERSTYAIAKERCTYANMVRRALVHHHIALRNRSEAQEKALKHGRATHPTKGSRRPQETRDRIGEGVSLSWKRSRPGRVAAAREQWARMSDYQKDSLRRLALDGVRRAAMHGSALELFLLDGLRTLDYRVELRKKVNKWPTDLILPTAGVAIRVDGPAHFLPIWGEERLFDVMIGDELEIAGLLETGLQVIQVKQLAKNLSEVQKRKLLTNVLKVLQCTGAQSRLTVLEVV